MTKYYEVYKILIVATTLAGVYFPSIEKIYGAGWNVKLLKLISIFPGVALPLYTVSTLKYIFIDEDEMGNKIYGCTLLVFIGIMTFTLFSFYYYRSDFVRVFELWDSMFQEDLYNDDREELLLKNRRVTNKWLVTCGLVSVNCSICYCLGVYFKTDKQMNHPSGIPYRHQSPDFELINSLDLIVSVFGFASLVTFDSMTMAFLGMEEAQLQHLKRSLAKIIDTVAVTEEGKILIKSEELTDTHSDVWKIKMASEEVEKKLRVWISHHHQLLRFHREFQKVFSIPLCAKFFTFVLMICLTCFLMLAGKFSILEMIFANAFCFTNYAVFYANIIFADSIIEESACIFEDAFEKSWYLYPKNIRDAFHIIQMNSYRPLHYLAFRKYSLSSKNFLKILSSAYSLFTFLLQTNRKKIKTLEFRTSSRSL